MYNCLNNCCCMIGDELCIHAKSTINIQLRSSIPSKRFWDLILGPAGLPFFSLFSFFSFFVSFGLLSTAFTSIFSFSFSVWLSFFSSSLVSDFCSGWVSCLTSSSFLDLALKLPRSSPFFSASSLVYFPIWWHSYYHFQHSPLLSSS